MKRQSRNGLQTFFRRFFNQQFKRFCLPDGPKVGSISISPRGDWRMPSDASSEMWPGSREPCLILLALGHETTVFSV